MTNKQVSPFLRMAEEGPVHWCPGCQEEHLFYVNRPTRNGARWSWNRDVDKPSFSPSMSITVGPVLEDDGSVALPGEQCHYYLKNGEIEFLDDCSHELRGRKVPLPLLPA